jgi:hypothetical protein
MADNVLGLLFEISADPSNAQQALDAFNASTGNALKQAAGHFQDLQQKAGGALGFLRDHLVITAGDLESWTRKAEELATPAAHLGEEFVHVFEKTGLTVEQVSALRIASDQTGTSLDMLARGMGLLARGASDMAKDSSPGYQALQKLGISATDAAGHLRPTHALMLEIAQAFSKMEDGGNKSALAMSLFGRSGRELIPFLNQGRDGIERLEAQAKKLGETMTEEDARAAQDLARETRALHAELEGLELSATKLVIPGLNVMAQALLGNQQAAQKLKDAGSELGHEWLENQKAFYESIPTIQQVVDSFQKLELVMSGHASEVFRGELDRLRQMLVAVSHAIHGSGLADDIDEFVVPAFGRATRAGRAWAEEAREIATDRALTFLNAESMIIASIDRELIAYGFTQKALAGIYGGMLKALGGFLAEKAHVKAIEQIAEALGSWPDVVSMSYHFAAAAGWELLGAGVSGLVGSLAGTAGGGAAGSGLAQTLSSAPAATAAAAGATPSPTSLTGLGSAGGGQVINLYVEGMISADNLTDVINMISSQVQNQSVVLKATTALQPTTSRI